MNHIDSKYSLKILNEISGRKKLHRVRKGEANLKPRSITGLMCVCVCRLYRHGKIKRGGGGGAGERGKVGRGLRGNRKKDKYRYGDRKTDRVRGERKKERERKRQKDRQRARETERQRDREPGRERRRERESSKRE